MKTYKMWEMITGEMITEITKNPSREFTRKSDGLHIKANEHGELIWDSGYQFLRLYDEWEEVKKPLTFIDVLELVEENKNNDSELKFILEHEHPLKGKAGTLKHIVSEMEYQLSSLGIARMLLEGKFYIEKD